MLTWLAPFLVVAVMIVLYLSPSSRTALMKQLNFCFALGLATAIVSILSGLNDRVTWLDWLAWLVAVGACGAIVWKIKMNPPSESS